MDITSVDKLLLAVVFLIPGFVAMKVYGVVSSSERLDASKSLVDALAFSCVIYAALVWPILWAYQTQLGLYHPALFGAFCLGVLFVAPAVAACAFYAARRSRWLSRWLPHPLGKPWDFVFSRRQWFYVIVTLNSGRRIGGLYGGESFSSNHPYDEQIFIETVWEIDEAQGFIEQHVRSKGMLIAGANIESVEFIGMDDGDRQTEIDSGDRAGRLAADEQGVSAGQ